MILMGWNICQRGLAPIRDKLGADKVCFGDNRDGENRDCFFGPGEGSRLRSLGKIQWTQGED